MTYYTTPHQVLKRAEAHIRMTGKPVYIATTPQGSYAGVSGGRESELDTLALMQRRGLEPQLVMTPESVNKFPLVAA